MKSTEINLGYPHPCSFETEIKYNEEIIAITLFSKAKDPPPITERLMRVATVSQKRRPLSELCNDSFLDETQDWMITAVKTRDHGVHPYLDCGIALLHLLIGASVEGVEIEVEYREAPVVAIIQRKV